MRGGLSQEQQSFDVVDEVCQSDFHFSPGDADGADEQIHPVLLLRENMLNLGADFRFRVVGAPDRAGHGASLWLFAMDMADEAVLTRARCRPLGAPGDESVASGETAAPLSIT